MGDYLFICILQDQMLVTTHWFITFIKIPFKITFIILIFYRHPVRTDKLFIKIKF